MDKWEIWENTVPKVDKEVKYDEEAKLDEEVQQNLGYYTK